MDLASLDLAIVPEAADCLHDFSAATHLREIDLSGVRHTEGPSQQLVMPPGLSSLNLARALPSKRVQEAELCQSMMVVVLCIIRRTIFDLKQPKRKVAVATIDRLV